MKLTCVILSTVYFLLIFVETTFAQSKNPTSYPYGGKPSGNYIYDYVVKKATYSLVFERANFDSTRFSDEARFIESRFTDRASFKSVQFNSTATFYKAVFEKQAVFERAIFLKDASFHTTSFKDKTDFSITQFNDDGYFPDCQFDSTANFRHAKFDSIAGFGTARFIEDVYFNHTQFKNYADFWDVLFNKSVDFSESHFYDRVQFFKSVFKENANFKEATFEKNADFTGAHFEQEVNFLKAKFKGKMNFNSATFNDKIDFREAFFDSSAQVDFGGAKIVDTLLIGNLESEILQSFDFNLTQLLPTGEYYNKVRIRSVRNDTIFIRGEVMPLSGAGAIILLHGPVHMRIQFEQLPFVKLPEKLGYFTKNFIIDGTKQASFRGDEYKRERFELDYLLDKSTKYQIQSTGYKKYSLFHPVAWWRFVYDATLGLGYRPFRLVWWVIAVILIFALCYFFTMSNEINRYLTEGQITKSAKENGKDHPLDRFINCIYFSSMVFFTFRLKRDILTTFANKQKWTIVGQWLIGFLILIGFLTLSKSGSILHTLKSLFVG